LRAVSYQAVCGQQWKAHWPKSLVKNDDWSCCGLSDWNVSLWQR